MKNPALRLRPATGGRLPLILGILALAASLLPAVLLGADGYVGIHDQMDGEILVYIVNARNFPASSFPEFMNGMGTTSLTPPSYGTLLFYLLMPPFAAYLCNYIFVALLSFVGMYLLLDRLLENKWLAAFVALMFSQLPFYSVYGLSVMGQPLLLYASLRLWQKEKPWASLALTALFAAFSSLVLVGFADVLLLICFAIVMQIRKHPNARYAWIQTAVLLVIYLLPNLTLLKQILFPSDVVTHKVEMVLSAGNLLSNFKRVFFQGMIHSPSLHGGVVNWVLLGALVSFIFYDSWTREEKLRVWGLAALIAVAAAIAAFYSLWHCAPVVALRNRLGGVFVSFQADRVYWLYPAIWFIILGLMLWLLMQKARRSFLQGVITWLCICVLVFLMGIPLYRESVFKRNVKTLCGSQAYTSWNEFYSPELFREIRDYIGLPQEEYRVASLALYPSVPLYNGFYCIDGYSNNYDVEYKHQFRTIISRELEKSESLRAYFDGWGNRCYLFSSEMGQSYFVTKDAPKTLTDLELSAEGLKQLGCSYILSGAEIANPAASGLAFVKTFENEKSPYRIWLYMLVY